MQKIFIIIGILFLTALATNAQVKTSDAKRLETVEAQIIKLESERQTTQIKLDQLRTRYNDDWKENQALIAQIAKIDESLVPLYLEKKALLKKELIKKLPNNDTELLKMIIIQNERIIELLEKMTAKRQ